MMIWAWCVFGLSISATSSALICLQPQHEGSHSAQSWKLVACLDESEAAGADKEACRGEPLFCFPMVASRDRGRSPFLSMSFIISARLVKHAFFICMEAELIVMQAHCANVWH